jgi:hypothetical protein
VVLDSESGVRFTFPGFPPRIRHTLSLSFSTAGRAGSDASCAFRNSLCAASMILTEVIVRWAFVIAGDEFARYMYNRGSTEHITPTSCDNFRLNDDPNNGQN